MDGKESDPGAFPEQGAEWIVRRPGSPERRWFRLAGTTAGLLWASPFLAIALVLVFGLDEPPTSGWTLLVLAIALLVFLPQFLWGMLIGRTWRYAIGLNEIMVERGIITVSRTFVAYDRIQYVDRKTGPLMKLLELAALELHTAAGGLRIYALQPDDATEIERRIRAKDLREELL